MEIEWNLQKFKIISNKIGIFFFQERILNFLIDKFAILDESKNDLQNWVFCISFLVLTKSSSVQVASPHWEWFCQNEKAYVKKNIFESRISSYIEFPHTNIVSIGIFHSVLLSQNVVCVGVCVYVCVCLRLYLIQFICMEESNPRHFLRNISMYVVVIFDHVDLYDLDLGA